MITNEQIKSSEVKLTGVNGEDLGVVATAEALRMARDLKVDLVCLSLMSSPPPCKLVAKSVHKQEKNKAKQQERKAVVPAKVKEIRVTSAIEEHDYDTKKRQAERILSSGNSVQLTVLVDRKQTDPAKRVAEDMVRDLSESGQLERGIQVSGKQVIALIKPRV